MPETPESLVADRATKVVVVRVWYVAAAVGGLTLIVAGITWAAAAAYFDLVGRLERMDRRLSDKLKETETKVDSVKVTLDGIATWREELERESEYQAGRRDEKARANACAAGKLPFTDCVEVIPDAPAYKARTRSRQGGR